MPSIPRESSPSKSTIFCSRCNSIFGRVVCFISKIFLSAIIFYVIGLLFPSIREKLPNFYIFVDFILSLLDKLYGFVVKLLQYIKLI